MENGAGAFCFLSAEQEEVTVSEVTIQRKLDRLLVQANHAVRTVAGARPLL